MLDAVGSSALDMAAHDALLYNLLCSTTACLQRDKEEQTSWNSSEDENK